MFIVTPRNDIWQPFDNMDYGEIFLNGNQDYCIKIPTVESFEEDIGGTISYNTVNLANGHLSFTGADVYILPLPESELHIKF
jgi:hypothetical protein